MKVQYDDKIKVRPSAWDVADDIQLATFENETENEGDERRNFYLTPKQARKLAKELKRAAKEVEAR